MLLVVIPTMLKRIRTASSITALEEMKERKRMNELIVGFHLISESLNLQFLFLLLCLIMRARDLPYEVQ